MKSFQATDGPLSPRGNERMAVSAYVFVTPRMWETVSLVAKGHGVQPPLMIRTILMTYLDLYTGNLPKFTWQDDRNAARSKKVHVTLTPSIKKRLEQVGGFHGMSNAQIVRMALHDYFSRHPATANNSPEARRAIRRPSLEQRRIGNQAQAHNGT